MNRSANALRLLGFVLALALFGCESGDTVETGYQKDNFSTLFCTAKNLDRSLLKQLDLAVDLQKSDRIQYPFCIYTEDIPRNARTESDVHAWSTTALNTWIEPLIGEPGWKVKHAEAYRVQRGSSGCPDRHNGLRVYKIRINDTDGANNSFPGFEMNMGDWGVHKLVVLHEVGHAIGLGDTYSWDGHRPIGQPTATMKDQWNLKGVLQQDDKDAIRFIWARLRGAEKPCPEGYVIGEVEGENWSGETYCVLGDDPVDECPDDPSKTEPGECGCGVPEGSCNGTDEIYQAEARTAASGCKRASNHVGFTGSGFIDFGGNGTWIEWNNVNVSQAGNYQLVFRYAVGGLPRKSAVIVNGSNKGNLGFVNTGSWTSWKTNTKTVALRQGGNTIRVQANTGNGGPNLDSMKVQLIGGPARITASGENQPREGKEKAFDGRTDTKWLTFADSAWIQYEFAGGTSKAVDEYTITSANDYPERDPSDWRLKGSNNGSSWTTLDTRSNQSFSARFQKKTYTFSNTTRYKMYRLEIVSNLDPPAANSTQLAEIEYIEGNIIDECPDDPNKTEPGECGCGVPEGSCWHEDPIITASADNAEKGEGKEEAFDGDNDTKWLTFFDSAWIGYEFGGGVSKVIRGYRIISANDHPERDPRDWKFLGSNDGTSWTTLDQRSGHCFTNRFHEKEYLIHNERSFKMYRLDISSNRDPLLANSTQIAEIELLEQSNNGIEPGEEGDCDVVDESEFTIGVIPDTQNLSESESGKQLMIKMTRFFVEHGTALNVKFVISLGDMTQRGNSNSEWTRTKAAYDVLRDAGIPYAPCQGNHDGVSSINKYFPVRDFEDTPTWGGSMNGGIENAFYLFDAAGMKFVLVVNEEPYDGGATSWANGIFNQYSNRRGIFAAHNIQPNGGEQRNLVTKHDNVFMAVAGHDCRSNGEDHWTDTSPSGYTQNFMLSDYQCRSNDGAIIRYYTFKPSEDQICARTFNITSNSYEQDGDSQFCFHYEMQ